MARVADAPADRCADIRNAFISCFPDDESDVRRLFDPAIVPSGKVRANDDPNFFAQLYLSCIVASATEETFDEGQFRERLAELLGLEGEHDYLSRGGLPFLWECLEDWSERAARTRPIRRLVLPDPGHETIIGYSKRLAFPSYRDQIRLSRIIDDEDLSVDSPLAVIRDAIGSRLSSFGRQFQQEYRRFYRCASSPNEQPTETPFWAAFESIRWSPPTKDSSRQRLPSIAITLEIRDLDDPELECLISGTSDRFPYGMWKLTPLEMELDGFSARLMTSAKRSAITDLLAGRRFGGRVRIGYLGRLIAQGCIPFEPGETLPWISCRSFPREGRGWLLARADIAERIREARQGLEASGRSDLHFLKLHTPSGWWLVGRLSSDDISKLCASDPLLHMLDALQSRLESAKIRLRNAIRLPAGVLFLKPMLPQVRCPSADAIHATRTGRRRASLVSLERTRTGEEELWRFPVAILEELNLPEEIGLRASRGGEVIDHRHFSAVHDSPSFNASLPVRPGAYGVETALGQIGDLNPETGEAGSEAGPLPRDLLRDCLRLTRVLPGIERGLPDAPKVEWIDVDHVDSRWMDLLEVCLALTAVRSRGISWKELIEICGNAWDVGGHQAVVIAKNLVQNSLLRRALSLRSRGISYFAAGPRIITTVDHQRPIRIRGLLGRLELARIVRLVSHYGGSIGMAVLGRQEALGTMQISGIARDSLSTFVEELDLPAESPSSLPKLTAPSRVLAHIDPRIDFRAAPAERKQWPAIARDGGTLDFTMETSVFERQPSQYVVLRDKKPVWATRSQAWAFTIYHRLMQKEPWFVSDEGLRCNYAAPEAFGAHVLARGRGVCGATWQADENHDATWFYPFDGRVATIKWLASWVARSEKEPSALIERWIDALAQTPAGSLDAALLEKRYLHGW